MGFWVGNCFLVRPFDLFLFLTYFIYFFFSACSSGDGLNVKPDDQKVLYDEVAKRRPSTILSLQHEVHGMFFLLFISLNVNSFAKFFSYRFQSPPCKSFNSGFFFFVVDRKICFLDMMSFHTRSKFFKKLDTSWLRLLNVLGNNPTLAWVLLPNQMYVFNLFLSAYFWLFLGSLLGIVKCLT